MSKQEYEPDYISLIDEDCAELLFEEVDRYQDAATSQRYIALLPVSQNPDEESDELIILKVFEENGETFLEPIENDTEFETVAGVFEQRLADEFDITR